MELLTQKCSKCGLQQVIDEFRLRKHTRADKVYYIRNSTCKICESKYSREYEAKHRDKVKAAHNAAAKRRTEVKKVYDKAYRDKTRIKRSVNSHEYYIKTREDFDRLIKYKYREYKYSAKKRGLEFDIEFKEFVALSKGKCEYCGDDILGIGLDRIDSSIGYIKSNVRRCCEICNKMKYTMTEREFMEKCYTIYNKLKINNLYTVPILDYGYMSLLRIDGCDVDVENSARTSFFKTVNIPTAGFIERLAKAGHMSPFRSIGIWLEIRMPIAVKGQFLKHIVGVSNVEDATCWNEQSFRGAAEKIDIYIPDARKAIGRWGQGDVVDQDLNHEFTNSLNESAKTSIDLYNKWIGKGISAECARYFLPGYAVFTVVRCKMSLDAAWHFYKLRSDSHAQLEIQEYAKAIDTICAKHFPISWAALKASVE